jgi:hypothetical protein
MSVWPKTLPAGPTLAGHDGNLVLVSIATEPRLLESLLEALARVDFPLNPEIYHNAAVVYAGLDGSLREEPVTLVEFPSYASGLDEVRRAVESFGFPEDSIFAAPMLDTLHTERIVEPAPPDAGYSCRWRERHREHAPVQ